MEDRAIDYVLKLMDIPLQYFIIAAAIGIVVGLRKKPSLGILAAYAFLLLVETVLIRKTFTGTHFQPMLFWSWKEWKIQKDQILTNIVMFIPVGFLTGWIWKWRGLWSAAGLSVVIEVLQLIMSRGLCEFDDVFHNMIGAVIGVVLTIVVNKIKGEEEHR